MAKPKPQPQVYLGRSLGATEVQIPAITNNVVALTPTTGAADTQALGTILPSTLVRVAATEDCYLRFDTSAVAATSSDTIMIRGVEAMLIPFNVTHVSAISIDNSGEVTITLYQ